MASTEREKRKKPEKANSKAVGQLRDILQGKKKSIDAIEFKDASVYAELNEEEYEDRKRRRQKFVVEDDDGMGYDDHGDEDLENDEGDEEDFDDFEQAEVDGPKRSKRAKVANKPGGTTKTAEKKKPEPLRSQRLAALMRGTSAAQKPSTTSSSTSTARKDKAKTAADDEIESMLEDLVANPKEKQKSTPSKDIYKLFKPKVTTKPVPASLPISPPKVETEKSKTKQSSQSPTQSQLESQPTPPASLHAPASSSSDSIDALVSVKRR